MQDITIKDKDSGIKMEAMDHEQYAEVYISRDGEEDSASLLLDKKNGSIIIDGKTITPLMWKMIKDLMDQDLNVTEQI